MKVEEWIPIKEEIAKTIEICGYVKNEVSGNWERQRKDNVMCSVVYLNKIPEDLNNIPVMFINSEDRDAKPSDRDIDTILQRTMHMIRKAIEKYNKKQEQGLEVVEGELVKPDEEPTPTPMPKQKPKEKTPVKKPAAKSNVPAKVDKPQTPAKSDDWRKGRSNEELAKEIDTAEQKRLKENTKKSLVGGSVYKPGGLNEVPTAKAIQEIANEPGIKISSEIREYEQKDDHASVKVRSYLGDQYVESVVYLDFKNEKRLKMIQLIRKYPHILDRFENGVPIIKDDAMITIGDKQVFAALHMYDMMLSYIKFSLRSATTTATTNNYKKLLNREWRSEEEIKMEEDERNIVQNSIETEKAMRRK